MNHVPGQNEVGDQLEADLCGLARMAGNSCGHSAAGRFATHMRQHGRLQVNGHDGAFRSHQPGHGNGKVPRPAAKVDDRITGFNVPR